MLGSGDGVARLEGGDETVMNPDVGMVMLR